MYFCLSAYFFTVYKLYLNKIDYENGLMSDWLTLIYKLIFLH